MTDRVSNEETARNLAHSLIQYGDNPDAIILAPPDGKVASIVSGLLRLPAEVFIARNLRAPCHCPCIIGALTETDVVYIDESVIVKQAWLHRELRAYIEREIQLQRAEIARQRQFLRSGRGLLNLAGRHILFVDDGASPLATLLAAIESFRKLGADKIVAAIPTESSQVIQTMQQWVDELVIPMPSRFVLVPSRNHMELNPSDKPPLVT
jgi:putative phosphoribosyl transferase